MFAIEDAGAVGMCLLDNPPPNFMYCSLTWNEDNVYAGGAFGNGNLTPVGKAFIDKLNKWNTPVDLAHLNSQSFYAAADISYRPFVSHTGLASCLSYPRNISDSQVRLIIEKHGIVGLSPVAAIVPRGNTTG